MARSLRLSQLSPGGLGCELIWLPSGRCQGSLTVLTPGCCLASLLPSAPRPIRGREGALPSAHCRLTGRGDGDAATEDSGAQLGNGDPGLLKTGGKVLPTTPSCLPASFPGCRQALALPLLCQIHSGRSLGWRLSVRGLARCPALAACLCRTLCSEGLGPGFVAAQAALQCHLTERSLLWGGQACGPKTALRMASGPSAPCVSCV